MDDKPRTEKPTNMRAFRRGTEIRLAVADLVRVTQAKAVAATSDENREQP